MTEELDQQVRKALQRRRRSRVVPIALVMFAIVASTCAYLWVNNSDQSRRLVFVKPSAFGSSVQASDGQPTFTRADFEAFARPTTDTLKSITDHLGAQEADLKRLTDQMAKLSAIVQTLQSVTSSMPAQTPVVPTTAPVAAPPPATIAQRRKLSAPKVTGSISVGGAPLPPAPLLRR